MSFFEQEAVPTPLSEPAAIRTSDFTLGISDIGDDPIAELEEDPRPDLPRAMRLFRDYGFHRGDWVRGEPGGGDKEWKIIKFIGHVANPSIPAVMIAHRSGDFKTLTFGEFRELNIVENTGAKPIVTGSKK